ncbi:hypothetical protein FQN54_002750 [Arachnomyces sp. PD_36]|nr:hypothetical protein FQN54_002750 [Arachnomyces sp. PD_36]
MLGTRTTVVLLLAFHGFGNCHVIQRQGATAANDTPTIKADTVPKLLRRDDDPTSFSWVRRLAAIGDSYTAGIGSGNLLGDVFHNQGDWLCSRYDMSYPMFIDNLIGPSIEDFQFPACSGDRSVQIYEQVQELEGDLNLVLMTAGGNDLCLAGIIKNCVMLPYEGEETCDAVLDKAQENIDTILKPNLKQILKALDSKMDSDGVVVYNGYARFFNTENEACAEEQEWGMTRLLPKYWFRTGLKLTSERRQRFNDLVVNINQAIRDVVKDVSDEVDYTIGFSDWDLWPIEGVKGQMCDPVSTGEYPDLEQPDLQFFKLDTKVVPLIHDELKRRDEDESNLSFPDIEDGIDKRIYDSLLWKSSDPGAEALHKLDRRAPSPPNCPGDADWIDPTLGLGLPDSFGKLFHPNELGHRTIASFAIDKTIDLRAKVLGIESETCEITDEFKCWQAEGRREYVTQDIINKSFKDFCDDVEQPEHTVGWKWEKSYWQDTPDHHSIQLQLSEFASDFNKEECLESLDRIVNGCDGNDPDNPMNWKFGGRWRRGEYTYEVNVVSEYERPWPVIQEPYGSCNGDLEFGYSHYHIKGTSQTFFLFPLHLSCSSSLTAGSSGAGWSSWDYGEQTIKPSMQGCLGLGITAWNFEYYDKPDEDGMEWLLTVNLPIFVNARCFQNNKVAFSSGGFTDGCGGSDW